MKRAVLNDTALHRPAAAAAARGSCVAALFCTVETSVTAQPVLTGNFVSLRIDAIRKLF